MTIIKSCTSFAGVVIVLALSIFMISNPSAALQASTAGLQLWFDTVLPALFPFFVVCDLMVNIGIVQFMARLLQPAMQKMFRLPGEAGFVIAMGFTSGFPVGAVLVRQLFKENLLNREQAEHLVSFTNNASPLFIIGIVGIGLFNSPTLGYLLAFSHYMSNLLLGFILGRARSNSIPISPSTSSLSTAFSELIGPKPSPGILLGEAIKKALANVTMVGGFIISFSVLTSALSEWGFIGTVASLFHMLGISYPCSWGLGIGLFEMTIGAQAISISTGTHMEKILAVTALLAWSGISVQAQVMSIVSDLAIRYSYYLKARILQAVLSFGFTIVGLQLVSDRLLQEVFSISPGVAFWPSSLNFLQVSLLGILVSLSFLTIISILSWLKTVSPSRSVH